MAHAYKLVVFTPICTYEVHGEEKELRPIFNTWMQTDPEDIADGDKTIIRGAADSFTRHPVSHCINTELIGAMSLIAWD